jgi:hypothetical protein
MPNDRFQKIILFSTYNPQFNYNYIFDKIFSCLSYTLFVLYTNSSIVLKALKFRSKSLYHGKYIV